MTNERLLRRNQVVEMTGLSYSSIYRAERNGTFPKRIRIGKQAVAWKLSEIQEWIRNRDTVDFAQQGDETAVA